MHRIKVIEIPTYRTLYAKEQNNICPLCNKQIHDPILEHNHKNGMIRGTTCRKCNSVLGSIENAGKRFGVSVEDLIQITRNFENHIKNVKPILHPTYRSPEEKKAQAKIRAAKKRKAIKESKKPQ